MPIIAMIIRMIISGVIVPGVVPSIIIIAITKPISIIRIPPAKTETPTRRIPVVIKRIITHVIIMEPS
jgi:hypothetical protein